MELESTEITSLKTMRWIKYVTCLWILYASICLKCSGGWYDLIDCVMNSWDQEIEVRFVMLRHLAQPWNASFLFSCNFSFKLKKVLTAMRSAGLTLVSEEIMEHFVMESISKYVNGTSQLYQGQILLDQGEMTGFAGEENVVSVVILWWALAHCCWSRWDIITPWSCDISKKSDPNSKKAC